MCYSLSSVENFGTNYFPLKIKILAKRERELITKFALARNGCYATCIILSQFQIATFSEFVFQMKFPNNKL